MNPIFTHEADATGVPQKRRSSYGGKQKSVVVFLVGLAALASIGPIGEDVLPSLGDRLPAIQQYVALACWILIGVLSALIRADRPRALPSLSFAALYLFALISVAWAHDPTDALIKSSALIIVGTCVYLCSSKLDAKDFMSAVRFSAVLLCLASFALRIVSPDVAITLHYDHPGEWEGIFGSKQNLGFAGALIIFVSAAELVSGHFRIGWRTSMLLPSYIIIGLVACAGSGSRGGALIALLAVAALFLGRRSKLVTRAVALSPILILTIASVAIGYLVYTGYDHFALGGTQVNFTRRTLIWHDAISRWRETMLFGFGINGYWSRPDIIDEFQYYNGWVLDNFHSGYLTVLIELGLVGYAIFMAMTAGLSMRLVGMTRYLNADRFTVLVCVGLPALLYTLNFTETFFMRSTNMFQAMFLFVFFKAHHISRAARFDHPLRR